MEISIEDLRQDIAELAMKDSRFAAQTPAETMCCVCVMDILFTDGAWSAIVCAMSGDMYKVAVTVDADGEASALGEASEVEQEISWEPVNAKAFTERMAKAGSAAERKVIAAAFSRIVARNRSAIPAS